MLRLGVIGDCVLARALKSQVERYTGLFEHVHLLPEQPHLNEAASSHLVLASKPNELADATVEASELERVVADRLKPFAENWTAQVRAPRRRQAELVSRHPEWRARAALIIEVVPEN